MANKKLTTAQQTALISLLKTRFEKNILRHKDFDWSAVEKKLVASADACSALFNMENTGGEPDIIQYDADTNKFLFVDCAAESPKERRSLCYDREALNARKEHKPVNDVLSLAKEMGVQLLTEAQYRALQQCGQFDCKTSSWILTPPPIRKLGGALFCDRRYDTVFTYHNGAESYYAARGFRACLWV
ncbi:MAG TPA: DUF4256 domain-containing protein [Flavihumibacter sp.]|nr:DUF4256 domain-containing protein [Flavihumibacter sp.]